MTALALALLSLATQDPAPATRPASEPAGVQDKGAQEEADSRPAQTPAEVRRAAAHALRWLAGRQAEDGRWSRLDAPGSEPNQADGLDLGITGLAVLAIRGAPKEFAAMHTDQAGKALAWLAKQCDEKGFLGSRTSLQAYNQAIGTLSLLSGRGQAVEAAGKAEVERSLGCIQKWRNPYKVWRYSPRDGDNDSSVTGWMALALLRAKAQGYDVDRKALQYCVAWYDEVTDPNTGQVGYSRRGEGSSRDNVAGGNFPTKSTEAMTALAVLVQARHGRDLDELRKSADLVASLRPAWTPEKGNVDLCYWLFGSLALQAAKHPDAEAWNRDLRQALLAGQVQDGKERGSWPPVDPWSRFGGRVFTTAMAMLCLQAAGGAAPL